MNILHRFSYSWELGKLFYAIFDLKEIITENGAISYLLNSNNKKIIVIWVHFF